MASSNKPSTSTYKKTILDESNGIPAKKNLQNIALNTHKAGMEGLDAEKINEIIRTASEGSQYYNHKLKCQDKLDEKIKSLKKMADSFTKEEIASALKQVDKMVSYLEMSRDLTKTIVHVDMDMFYAAVEMRDDPSLRNVPMAVGSTGMLCTSNYAARKFGVRAAMPGFIAKKLCPMLKIITPNMAKYKVVSKEVETVFQEYDPNYCMMSLDEAYLDITKYLETNFLDSTEDLDFGYDQSSIETTVAAMRNKIFEKTGLTASAGIACNTRLAKVCSDLNKPNGQYYLHPNIHEIKKFVTELSIRKVSGIGNVSEQQLNALNIHTCGDLWNQRGLLFLMYSETSFQSFIHIALGLGETDLSSYCDRDRKSISTETTFTGTSDKEILFKICNNLIQELCTDLEMKNICGKVVTLKIKTTDFKVRTRAQTLTEFTQDFKVLQSTIYKLLLGECDSCPKDKPLSLRLIGVRLSTLSDSQNITGKQKTLTELFKKSEENSQYPNKVNNSKSLKIEEQCFECPVCHKLIKNVNLLKFNDHIDNCLSTTQNTIDKKRETLDVSISNHSNLFKSVDKSSSKNDYKEPYHSLKLHQNSLAVEFTSDKASIEKINNYQLCDRNGIGDHCGAPDYFAEKFKCPVCEIKSFPSLDLLNRHIDECLTLKSFQSQNDFLIPKKKIKPTLLDYFKTN